MTNQLVNVLLAHQTPQEMSEFLRGILTVKELKEINKRLQIVKLLKQGMSQRLIARQLGVGIATVTRGAKELPLGRFKHVNI